MFLLDWWKKVLSICDELIWEQRKKVKIKKKRPKNCEGSFNYWTWSKLSTPSQSGPELVWNVSCRCFLKMTGKIYLPYGDNSCLNVKASAPVCFTTRCLVNFILAMQVQHRNESKWHWKQLCTIKKKCHINGKIILHRIISVV